MQTLHVTLEDIRDHFGAGYVITDHDHRPLAAKLAAATDFAELVYPSSSYAKSRDAPYLIFRVGTDVERGRVGRATVPATVAVVARTVPRP